MTANMETFHVIINDGKAISFLSEIPPLPLFPHPTPNPAHANIYIYCTVFLIFLQELLTGKHEDEQLQVKVERGPRGRLVLTDRGNDRDVVLCVGGIQERVKPPSPRRDL